MSKHRVSIAVDGESRFHRGKPAHSYTVRALLLRLAFFFVKAGPMERGGEERKERWGVGRSRSSVFD